jgi:hypothetical protein
MKKIIVLLGVGIMLFGCAHRQPQQPQVWVRPNSTEQEFNTDKYECIKEVMAMSGQQSHMAYGSLEFVIISNQIARNRAEAAAKAMFEACMQSKGWMRQQEAPKTKHVESYPSETTSCYYEKKLYYLKERVCMASELYVCDRLSGGIIGWRKLEENCPESVNPTRRRFVGDGVNPPFPRHLQEGCYWILDKTNWKEGNIPPRDLWEWEEQCR